MKTGRKLLVMQIFISLSMGTFIYLFLRPPIGVFRLFSARDNAVIEFPSNIRFFREFVLYHLPDMSWTFALASVLWLFTGSKPLSLFVPFFAAACFELMQFAGIVSGTADFLDVFFSAFGLVLFYFINIFHAKRRLKNER